MKSTFCLPHLYLHHLLSLQTGLRLLSGYDCFYWNSYFAGSCWSGLSPCLGLGIGDLNQTCSSLIEPRMAGMRFLVVTNRHCLFAASLDQFYDGHFLAGQSKRCSCLYGK